MLAEVCLISLTGISWAYTLELNARQGACWKKLWNDLMALKVEENRFLSVRDGLERSVLVQQQNWLEETTLLEKTKQMACKIDLQHAARLRQAKAGYIKQHDQKLERLHKEQRMARTILFMEVFFHKLTSCAMRLFVSVASSRARCAQLRYDVPYMGQARVRS